MDKSRILEVLTDLENRNINLWTEDNKIKFKAATGVLKEEDKYFLKANKEAVIEYLNFDNVKIINNYEHQYEPFPLTEIQQAYVLGRNTAFEYGGTACHIYIELVYSELNGTRVEEVWNTLIKRHQMLRAVMSINGYQIVLNKWDRFKVKSVDLKNQSKEEILQARDEIKSDLDHKIYPLEQSPMYSLVLSESKNDAVLHFSIEFLVADWTSIWTVLSEFETLYFDKKQTLEPIELSFRDYLVAEGKLRQGSHFYRDKNYWIKRLETFLKAPILPIQSKKNDDIAKFTRQSFTLNLEKWGKLQAISRKFGVTPTATVITAYSMCLSKWSQNKDFCLNLSILNRLDLHPQVRDIVGDFTASSLLEINHKKAQSFEEIALQTNRRLFEDLDHRLFTGVHMMRELQRINEDKKALMPYVFTGAIGLISNEKSKLIGVMNNRGISQTPQVFIDCQAMDTCDGLNINLDSRDNIFPEGLVEDLFESFKMLLENLSVNELLWKNNNFNVLLPRWQKEERKLVNTTETKQENYLLHQRVIESIFKNPNRMAVIDDELSWTGKELYCEVQKIVTELYEKGVKSGDIVAIALPKSRWQLASSLAVLSIGAIYIPLDIKQAIKRSESIIEKTNTAYVITLNENKNLFADNVQSVVVDTITKNSDIDLIDCFKNVSPQDLAYIIYTSGSTGEPKGVAITHEAAVNTIEAINNIYNINENDRIFSLSQFNFDLSVYDFFGVIAVGGVVVIPNEEHYKNPTRWVEMINKYKINVWNSVPALMQLLLIYLSFNKEVKINPLRLVLLSGDWIPKEQPRQLREIFADVQVVSLGGATEGGIWSIYHNCVAEEMDKTWNSIPYGKPLPNQGYRILDAHLNDCPVWVAGELYITGNSLAHSYYKQKELTDNAFVTIEGIRHYKTGDMGCYRLNGEIEFLGRIDNQVKIRGHRIELGEIETAYKLHFNVNDVCCVVVDVNGEKKIVAIVVYNGSKDEFNSKILKNKLEEWLPEYMIPSEIIIRDSIPLLANGKVDRKKANNLAKEFVENKGQELVEDRELSVLEKQVFDILVEELNIKSLALNDDFYDMGANSLILARVAGKLGGLTKEKIPFDAYLIQLLNEPNIASLVKFIEKQSQAQAKEDDISCKPEIAKEIIKIKENCKDLCIIFSKNMLTSINEIYKKNQDYNFIFIDKFDNHNNILKVINENENIIISSMDSAMNESLDLASNLMAQGIIPNAVNIIESDKDSEIDVEVAYMGNLFFALTVSNIEDKDEIIETLEELCIGEITVVDCKENTDLMNFAFNGLICK